MPEAATIITILGMGLCLPLLLILSAWAVREWMTVRFVRRQFRQWQSDMRVELDRKESGVRQRSSDQPATGSNRGWNGWRKFQVHAAINQTESSRRVWLEPVDGKPVAGFLPGQYLTLRLRTDSKNKPLVRCYSISGPIEQNRYELTVKQVARENGAAGHDSASRWINSELMPGDILEVKSPAGDFILDECDAPLVLIAAGVGITPLASMIAQLVKSHSRRRIVLLYGNRNSADHIFRKELAKTAATHPAMTVVNFYSAPLETDRPSEDYQIQGRISIESIRKMLPDRKFLFYLCGPAGFMNTLYEGLLDWGVPNERIRREAFGPASLHREKPGIEKPVSSTMAKPVPVNFRTSHRSAECTDQEKSILELAESIAVEIASGCRAGSCGSCSIRLLQGKVRYTDPPSAEVDPGFCLACIAHPDGPVEVEA